VVAGREPGAGKMEDARKLGTQVLSERQFLDMLGIAPRGRAAPDQGELFGERCP
jgi:BRCT domain type II-containing protein